jgi:hypothetical protein
MNQQVYDIAKVLHVVGIVAAAGMSLMDLVIFRYFWKLYQQHASEGIVVERLLVRLQRVMAIGMMLIIVSGVTMMYYLHTVWGQQLWFRIKFGILLVIIINSLAFRRTLGRRIHAHVIAETGSFWVQQGSLRSGITSVQWIQVILFVIIFILSVFKFN